MKNAFACIFCRNEPNIEYEAGKQYVVQETEEDLKPFHLPVYAMENIEHCSTNSSLNALEVFQSCSFSMMRKPCNPSDFFAVACSKRIAKRAMTPEHSKCMAAELELLIRKSMFYS